MFIFFVQTKKTNEKKTALLVKKFSIYIARFTKNDKLGLCPQTYHFSTLNLLHKLRKFFQCRDFFIFYSFFVLRFSIISIISFLFFKNCISLFAACEFTVLTIGSINPATIPAEKPLLYRFIPP